MGTNETAGGSGNTGPSEFKHSNTGHAHDNYVNCSAAGGMTFATFLLLNLLLRFVVQFFI